jgi:hypothetical protein
VTTRHLMWEVRIPFGTEKDAAIAADVIRARFGFVLEVRDLADDPPEYETETEDQARHDINHDEETTP